MSVCTHRNRNSPCGKPAKILRYTIKYDKLIEVHRCIFHNTLVTVGYETEEEAWASLITEKLTQDYNYDD